MLNAEETDAGREGWGDGIVRELGMDMYTVFKMDDQQGCSIYTGHSAKCYVAVCGRREFGENGYRIRMAGVPSLFT